MRLPLTRLMTFRTTSFLCGGGHNGASGSTAVMPVHQRDTRIRLSPLFSRKPHPDAAIEASFESIWADAVAANPRIFNASKFRLHEWVWSSTAAGALSPSSSSMAQSASAAATPLQLELSLGLTDYKTYLTTCCSTHVTRLLRDGQALHQDAYAFLSRKVGVSGVVETSNGHLAFIRRSRAVGVYQGLFDTPGGHPEPSHIGLDTTLLEALSQPGNESKQQQTETAATQELFASISNEVHEEINVSMDNLEPPLLLGMVLQAESATPSFAFHIRCRQTAAQLRESYAQGPKDRFESSHLELIASHQLLDETQAAPLMQQFTPAAQGSIELWTRWRQGHQS
ncbi:TPA: hypothetical protein N0F65_012930 [Lagenidium giganteum]|uniref:Nudix hydrolase domain-containing protein n=1 Tax=Lagenidium giganteum TaxID=4803 RepID=A0AAV2Z2W8_9STRA|nr:TPA: hypothetical protein N0F65_012930 [Lagenidium giganteum]